MSSIYITRQEAAELSGLTLNTVKNAIDKRIVPEQDVAAQSVIDVRDVAMLVTLQFLDELSVDQKRQVRDWLWAGPNLKRLELTEALVVQRTARAERALRAADRYVTLRDKWITTDPDIRDGEPIIAGSRVSVHLLAERIAHGESDAILDEDFLHIPREARDVAVTYARTHPRRGRPRKRGTPA